MEVPNGVLKHLLIGFVGGGVVGIAILIFLDRADDRMTSSSEMMEQFNEPILGQIPDVVDSRGACGLPCFSWRTSATPLPRRFARLRSSLIFMPNQAELRTLLMTSAIPNEGKSTIASNLAITMAASGANVVWSMPTCAGATSPRSSTSTAAPASPTSHETSLRRMFERPVRPSMSKREAMSPRRRSASTRRRSHRRRPW